MNYWQLNAIFLAAVAVVGCLAIAKSRRAMPVLPILGTLGILLLVTAVFDNVMIGIGLVGYDAAKISGAFIGIAPLEDFAYAVAAAVLLPSLWLLLPGRSREES
ncbi:lycopene cyclase domain-containing protein [Glaciihabitans sp. INWT7]|uniref:lycopene cyclase domain-containing protein n=1 Tax=Glaciihabitans sp. INWT7 TaxID=2596912 RepID=UPI00162A2674|nr:lycopene cyclase domain-containing protein [Glaciihabitans sp. INWT7]QNE48162.1 lycopene cyclase domain-containing protein [Glaciihabitans sp. INWT7]